jgi:TPR repeat protein
MIAFPRLPRSLTLTLLITLLLSACASTPPRPVDSSESEALAVAGDGRYQSALRVANLYEQRGDIRALDWLERAANTTPRTFHNTQAEERLGRILEQGRLDNGGKPQPSALKASPRKAYRWYHRAAYHGSPYAMRNLEQWYMQRGDMSGALRWRLRSAVYLRELYKLDALRTATSGSAKADAGTNAAVAPSSNKVIVGIQRRATRGDAEAQVDLGTLYEAGIGVRENKAEALHWYQHAASQGNVYGQYFSGLMLGRGGRGVEKDQSAAAAWFAKAYAQQFYMAEESYWRSAIAPPFFIFE